MGQFSWLYSNNGKQMLDDVVADSYLLVPKEFRGEYGDFIKETCYDGYGHFDEKDVFELVAIWNRDFIPSVIEMKNNGEWCASVDDDLKKDMNDFYLTGNSKCLRRIGIVLACYDEDNSKLKYPIKITSEPLVYEDVAPSEVDERQGW